MSNRTVRFFVFGMAVILVTSCFAKESNCKFYEGPRLPPENIAILTISGMFSGLSVVKIDNVEIPGVQGDKTFFRYHSFEVLPGEHSLSVDYQGNNGRLLSFPGVAFHAEAGKAYELSSRSIGFNRELFLIENTSKAKGKAAEELKAIDEAQTIDPLIASLKSKNFYVRWGAALALAKIGPPAVEPLIAALKSNKSDVRSHAAWALGKTNDARAGEPLIALMNDEDADVRCSAAAALGEMRDARAVDRLIYGLTDEDANTQRSAAWALGEIRDPRAVTPLKNTLKNEFEMIRKSAALALEKLNEPR